MRSSIGRLVVGGAVVGAAGLGLLGALTPASLAAPAAAFPPARSAEEARIELGRRLFFDPLLSRTGQRACSFCHDPEHGFSDPNVRSADDFGPSQRHSQTLVDSARNPSAHWDGSIRTIEDLVRARIGRIAVKIVCGQLQNLPVANRPPPGEPRLRKPGEACEECDAPSASGFATHGAPFGSYPPDLNRLPDVAQQVEDAGRYAEAFQAAFDTPQVSVGRMADAIAAYCRTLVSATAPIDRFLAGDEGALGRSARRGLELFRGRAGCVQCHVMEGKHPLFTDHGFHVNGVAWRSLERAFANGRESFDADEVLNADLGRENATTARGDRRKFKTPTLRDLPRRGPYMHDGSFRTLAGIVRHYAAGGSKDPRQDPRIRPFELGAEDEADLVAFLEALNGEQRPGLAPRLWHARAAGTRLRFVDARQRALAGLRVTLVPEGDALPTAGPPEGGPLYRVTDERGWIEVAPGSRTHLRLSLPEGVVPVGGALVPDTCVQADVVVPVDGRVRLVVPLDAGTAAPERLVAEHDNPMRLAGDLAPRTVFVRMPGPAPGPGGHAVYEGWHRTDASDEAQLLLPGAGSGHRLRLAPGATLSVR